MSRCPRLPALALLASYPVTCFAADPASRRTWDTCSLTEGKDSGCGPGERPRPFKEFLTPAAWVDPTRRDWFSGEFQFDIGHLQSQRPNVIWHDVGSFGSHRVRDARMRGGENEFAGMWLAESSRGIFSLLLKWAGAMPDANSYEVNGSRVLVVTKNYGGNIPMFSTWAWIRGPLGPIRLDVDAAIEAAIGNLGPDYHGYNTGLDWTSLHCLTGVWQGGYPGKIGVGLKADIWFEIKDGDLAVRASKVSKAF